MAKYFGTDGFRGEANVNLTAEHAYKIGRFLGWYYGSKRSGRRARVVIGKDTRRSSYMFEYALAAGLTASGADACLLHVTTTPSVSYVVRTEDFEMFNISAYNRAVSENVPIITVEGWEDVHPLLRLIPADWEDSIPFGVFYSPTPTKLVKKFVGLLSSIAAK